MKKLLLLLIALSFFGCEKKEEPFKIDPDAMVLLRGDESTGKGFVNGLTPLEIVENGVNIKFQSRYFGNDSLWDIAQITYTFAEAQKDFNIPALKMWGTSIISDEGEYYRDFTHGFNVYITDNNNDTIAQVTDEVIVNAKLLIEAAFEAGDYEEVYRIFNEAFTFQPFSK